MNYEMQYIYEVYAQGSFSKAAQALYITQPALSIAVKKIENDIGMPLFNRRESPITLTAAGEIYIAKIEKIKSIEKELFAEINDINNLATGSITVAGTNYINSHVLPPVISSFMRKFPEVNISLIESSSSKLQGLIDDGKIDISFMCGDINKIKFRTSFVFKDTILLAIPSKDVPENLLPSALPIEEIQQGLFHKGRYVNLSNFANLPFIILREQNNLHRRCLRIFNNAGIKPTIIQELDQLVTAYHFCSQGIGATFVSSILASKESLPNVTYFEIDSNETERLFYAVTKKNTYLPIAVKEFIKDFQAMYGTLQ